MIVTAAPQPGSTLAGHVLVEVVDQHPDTATVTVRRRANGRTLEVRGLVDRPPTADLYMRDFEAGFGVESIYTATAYSLTGKVLETASARVFLQSPASGVIVVHDPIRPTVSLTIKLESKAFTGGTRPTAVTIVPITGQSTPIALPGVRPAWTGVRFDAVTLTNEQAVLLDTMLGGYDDTVSSGVLCIRATGNVPAIIPRTFFATVEATPSFYYPGEGRRETVWQLTAREVMPPAPALFEPLVTWADLNAWIAAHGGNRGFNEHFPTLRAAGRSLEPLGWADR